MLSFIDRITGPIGRFVMSPRHVLAIWTVVLGAVFIMRAFLFTGADADDSEQLVCMQDWVLSCGPRNPPLFTWLGLIVQTVLGPRIVTVIVVKFGVIAGCLYFLYRASVLVLQDRRLAALVALSPIGIYYFAWDALFHYTHSVMVSLAVCLTFYLMLVLERRRDLAGYVLFGIGIGVGALSKFNYMLFLGGLLIAMARDAELRPVLRDRRMLLSAAIGVVAASPFYIWLWFHRSWASALAQDRFTPGGEFGSRFNIAGLGELLSSTLNFVLPLAIFLVLCFPRAWWRPGAQPAVSTRYRRVLERTFLIMLAVTLVAVLAFGASRIRTHYMFVLIPFPLLVIARAQAAQVSERALNLFATVLLALAVIVPVGVAVKYAIDPLRGSKAYYHVPYEQLSAQLREAGFTRGTIVADSLGYPLAGNFLPYFPTSRIVNLLDWQLDLPDDIEAGRTIAALPPDSQGQCLLIWTPDPGGTRFNVVAARVRKLLHVDLPDGIEAKPLTAKFHNGRGRTITFAYILLPATGNCR